MAKIMVEIDVPGSTYDELRERLINNPDASIFEPLAGKDAEDNLPKLIVPEKMLRKSRRKPGAYVFGLIGVRP